jgi:hypothetical protein
MEEQVRLLCAGSVMATRRATRGVIGYDIQIQRDYNPVYSLGRGYEYDSQPRPPIRVQVVVEFDDPAAALAFEALVRQQVDPQNP